MERPPAGINGAAHKRSMSKEGRRLRFAALGVILLGLWGMLALLLGTSLGMESNRRRALNPDMAPGFGETHATGHKNAGISRHEDLPPPCLGDDCAGIKEGFDSGYPASPTLAPGDEGDDATSAIGRPRGPDAPAPAPAPGLTSGSIPNWLFVPNGDGVLGSPEIGNSPPGGPDVGNPFLGGPDIGNPPQTPGDTSPPDFTQPPLSHPLGPDGPRPNGSDSGPKGPGSDGSGPDGPPKSGQEIDPPQQLPEPLTLSLFAGGLAGSILLRRRRRHSSK